MSTTNPYASPETPGASPPLRTRWRGPWVIEVLVVVFVVGMLIALLLPARRTAREPARRSTCSNNLKNIALALNSYEAVNGSLPPAYTVDADGRPLHSWRTLILPYLDLRALYDTIDLSKPWDDPVNKVAFDMALEIYRCPSTAMEPNETIYRAVVAADGCFPGSRPRKLAEIRDDHNLTLMFIEADADRPVPWMSPLDAVEQAEFNMRSAPWLPHAGGAHGVALNGRVHFVPLDATPEQMRALVTVAGNDDVLAAFSN